MKSIPIAALLSIVLSSLVSADIIVSPSVATISILFVAFVVIIIALIIWFIVWAVRKPIVRKKSRRR